MTFPQGMGSQGAREAVSVSEGGGSAVCDFHLVFCCEYQLLRAFWVYRNLLHLSVARLFVQCRFLSPF
jgi:hypothetical protein